MEISIEIIKKDVPSNVSALAKNISQLAFYGGLKPTESSAFEDKQYISLCFRTARQMVTQELLDMGEGKNQSS